MAVLPKVQFLKSGGLLSAQVAEEFSEDIAQSFKDRRGTRWSHETLSTGVNVRWCLEYPRADGSTHWVTMLVSEEGEVGWYLSECSRVTINA